MAVLNQRTPTPDVFGNVTPTSGNPNYYLTPQLLIDSGLAQPTSRFDSYEVDSIFGQLGSYFGSNIRAALESPIVRSSDAFTGTKGSVDYSVGVDFALFEKINTFGTPEFFRNLASQLTVVSPETQFAVDKILANINPVSYSDSAARVSFMNSPSTSRVFSLGGAQRDNEVSVPGATVAFSSSAMKSRALSNPYDYYGTSVSTSYANRKPPSDIVNGKQYTYGIPNAVQSLNSKDSFIGNGSGAFQSAVYHIGTSSLRSTGSYGYPTVGMGRIVY